MKLSDIEIGAGFEITAIRISGLSVTLTLAEVKDSQPVYRTLSPEERIQKGDEWFDSINLRWSPAGCVGLSVNNAIYRRRV